MTFPALFLQPRGNQPSWPTDPGQPTQPVPTPETDAGVGTTTGAETGAIPVVGVDQTACESANRNMLVAAGGYNFGAIFAGLLVFLLMRKKLWSTVFGRYLTAILVAAVIATSLAAWDPARQEMLQLCLNSADYARYVFLHDVPVARALVLGLAPSSLLTLVACLIANRT